MEVPNGKEKETHEKVKASQEEKIAQQSTLTTIEPSYR